MESVFGGIEYELLTLDRISEHQLNDVIEKPAARVRCHIEPDLVDRLIKDTVTTTALPFLAFALRELYDTVPTGQPWGLRDYEVLGEPSGDANPIVACVRGRANEAVFGTTPESDFDGDLRRAFVPMMTDISDNDQPILRTARWADLPPRALPALRRLEAARICFSTVDHDNAPCVSIAHGSLYQAWPPLQRAFEAEKRRLAEWRQAERSAQAWEQRSFSSAWIDHRGLRLIQLSRLARSTDYKGRISQRLHDYIAACRRHALLVLSRRAALAAAVVGIIATFGHEYSMRARLLGAADQVVDSKPFLGGALAFAALPPPGSLFPVQEGRALALLARSKLAFARGLFAPGHGLESVAFSPEGHSLAAASDQGDVSVWSTDTAAVLRRIAVLPQRALQVVKYSPSGNTIATGGADGVLYLIETGSWQIRASNRVHTAAINDLAFDAAGANILTVSVDGTAVQWDAATLDLRAKLALPSSVSGRLNCVAYGRDGSIVIGGTDKTVWRWRNAADAEPKTVRTENATIHSCDLDRNVKRVVIGTDDGHLAIIDLNSSSVDEIVSVPTMAVRAGVFSPDGGTVASAWDDHALRLTRLTSSGAPDTMVVDFHREPVRAAAFGAAGTRVASASSDNNDTGDAVVWDVAALQKNVVPAADAVFASICSSAIASRLTLWRPDSANGNTFEPTPDCACAGRGLLSKAFWTSVTARLGWAKAASVCSYTGS